MTSFDSMFSDRQNCYFALFQDVVYEHDNKINYLFEAGNFKRRNKVAVIKQIASMSDIVYKNLTLRETAFDRCQPIIDYPSLLGVFTRYSRDIYGSP